MQYYLTSWCLNGVPQFTQIPLIWGLCVRWTTYTLGACLFSIFIHSNVFSVIQAALCAAPYKDDFLKALSKGQNVKEEECIEKIRQFLVNYTTTIEAIYIMYNKMNAELDYKA